MRNKIFTLLLTAAALLMPAAATHAQTAVHKKMEPQQAWGNLKQHVDDNARMDRMSAKVPILRAGVMHKKTLAPSLHRTHAAGSMMFLSTSGRKAQSRVLATTASGTQLWGNVIYRDDWDEYEPQYGIYGFATGEQIQTWNYMTDNEMIANGGGAFVDDAFHCVQYATTAWGDLYTYYFKYDTTDWLRVSGDPVDISYRWDLIARCTAVDPTSGTIYGIFSNDSGTGFEFGTINYDDFSRTTISVVETEMMAMACNSKGQIYAISLQGDLYSVDKTTGAQSLIGATGFVPEAYLQSATFDPKDDHLYWAAIRGDQSVLLDVDTTTGSASKVADFPNFEEVLCLYAPFVPEEGAPSAVSDLRAEFVNGSLTGSVCFTLPSLTVGGTALASAVGYQVLVDGEVMVTGSGEPASAVSEPLTLSAGEHKIKVITSNESGQGEQAFIIQWIGPDQPSVLDAPVFGYDAATGMATLTWTIPQYGVNGGYIDTESLTFDVVRYPGAVQVATGIRDDHYSEALQVDAYASYYYTVTMHYGDSDGEPVASNRLLLGNALDLPYYQYFDTDDALDLFTVIDGNDNGNTWTLDPWTGCATYIDGWSDLEGDDWLLTPPVRMKNDRQYTVTFKLRAYWEWYNEAFETAIGQGGDPMAYKQVIPVTTNNSEKYVEYSNVVTVDQDGDYQYGIHIVSPSFSYGVMLDSLSIVEGAKFTAPDSVTAITVQPGAMGAKTATVTFTTPDKTADGSQLDGIYSVALIVDDTDTLAVIDNVECLEQYTMQAEGIVGDGWHKFTVVATNNAGNDYGVPNSQVAWIGYDVPMAPTDVRLADNLDGTSTLTWTAPVQVGIHGGYVDNTLLTYNVYRIMGYDWVEPLADGIDGTSWNGEMPQTGDQELIELALSATSAGGEGATAAANTMFSGEPYTLPFHESFANGGTDMPIWGVTESEDGWAMFYSTMAMSADGDNGCMVFSPFNDNEGSTFYSGKISLQGAVNPMMIFSYYAVPGLYDNLSVYVRTPDGDRIKMDGVDFSALEGEEGWRRMGIDLNPVKHYAYVNVDFDAFAGETLSPIYVDDINIRDTKEQDIKVAIEASDKVLAGQDLTALVNVENIGCEATGALTIGLYVGGTLTQTVTSGGVAYLEDETFSFVHTTLINDPETLPVEALVTMADGTVIGTGTATVAVEQPGYTTVDNLTAESVAHDVALAWSLPQYVGERQIESFEDYEPFSIGGADGTFGEWKTVDGDLQCTAGFRHLTYDNEFDPKAFMIFQPRDLWKRMYPQLTPQDGNQYIAAFSPESVNADDWLISPALSGAAQTISLFVRSYSETVGLEDFEIRYSTESSDTADFKMVAYQGQAPADWTEVEVDLPEGAVHFAIHYTSKTKVMFMVDQVAYEKGDQTVTGFRVYRDGTMIGQADADAVQYVDANAPEGTHVYNVTVLYMTGESSFSNDAYAEVSGIADVRSGTAMVTTEPGIIVVANANGMNVQVFAADGSCVCDATAAKGTLRIPAQRGQYIVRVDDKVFNIVVR